MFAGREPDGEHGGRRVNVSKPLLRAVFCGAIVLGALLTFYGSDPTWKLWGVPTMTPSFADTRVITAGCESRALGLDSLVNNPRDPWGRQMNYPRVWQKFCDLGVDQGATPYIGIAFAVLFGVGIILSMPADIDKITMSAVLCALFSPAVLLGLERGNSDLLVFFLLSVTIYLMSTGSNVLSGAAVAAVATAFILKLYPLFGCTVFLRTRLRAVAAMTSLSLVAAAYLVITHEDLVLIRQVTQTGIFMSYGMSVVPMFIANQYGAACGDVARLFSWGAFALCCVLAIAGLRSPAPNRSNEDCRSPRSLDAYRVGTGIYIGSFLLGSNWDYRLMFLVFTIPQLMIFARSQTHRIAPIAKTVLAGIFLALWYLKISQLLGFISEVYFFIDEVGTWTVLFGLAYLLACSAPAWIRGCFVRAAPPPDSLPAPSTHSDHR